jgi:hypothetical protein
MRKWILALALAATGLSASDVQAQFGVFRKRPPNAPIADLTANQYPPKFYKGGQVLPVFQAAPWYLYWPYDAHFQTPAPIFGAYYAPPIGGNFPVQPYFPAPIGVAPVPKMGKGPAFPAPPVEKE